MAVDLVRTEELGEKYVRRFLRSFLVDDGCWTWNPKSRGGRPYRYGTFWDGRKREGVHRFAYRYWHGEIPQGLTIDHLCFNTRCVRPDHLEAVTQAENNRRAGARKTHCPKDHAYPTDGSYVYNGCRSCRQCAADRKRRQRQREKERSVA